MNEKQAELCIIVNEIYNQSGKSHDIVIERLSEEQLDKHHADKLLLVRYMLTIKKSKALLNGESVEELDKKIELFEEIYVNQGYSY